MTYFKDKWCFVGNGLFISRTASCKFTPLWKPHFLPIVQVLLKSAVLLSAWMSNSHSSVNLMSCHVRKELRWCTKVYLHFEGVCVEWAGEGGREGRGPKFQMILCSFLTKLQVCYLYLLFLDVGVFVSWTTTPTSPQTVGYERWDKCQNLCP